MALEHGADQILGPAGDRIAPRRGEGGGGSGQLEGAAAAQSHGRLRQIRRSAARSDSAAAVSEGLAAEQVGKVLVPTTTRLRSR